MPFNGFGGANLQQLMKQAQKMQEEIQQKREELDNTNFYANAGGGMVDITMNGKYELKSIKIKPDVIDPNDVEMLEDLITAAINDATKQIQDKQAELMPQMPGGMF